MLVWNSIAFGFQVGAPNSTLSNNSDGFAVGPPVMTFVDPSNGQQYGRYIIHETVPVAAYSYQEVKESVYVPKTVTENKITTVTEYVPIQSQQLQPKNVPSWNPLVPPQQVWQYVPIVYYQPKYTQVNQPVTYQQYELKEVSRMVPVFGTQSKQVPRYVDRPLGQSPNGGNLIAYNPNSATNPATNPASSNPNPYQQAAQIAQANRATSRYPTRPIDYPATPGYQSAPNRNIVAQAPAPYYPNPYYLNPNPNPAAYSNPMVAGVNGVAQPTPYTMQNVANAPMGGNNVASNTTVIPAVPVQPNMQPNPNAIAGSYGNPAYGSQNNGYAPNPAYPYANTASRPLFTWPAFATSKGSLFSTELYTSTPTTSYIASNTPVSQPYLWGNSTPSGATFRPNTSPYATPQPSWGMTPANNYRDPMQGGMPASVLR